MSVSEERLARLNAYLISKGRNPRTDKPVDFVKKNISSLRRNGRRPALSDSTNKGKRDADTTGRKRGHPDRNSNEQRRTEKVSKMVKSLTPHRYTKDQNTKISQLRPNGAILTPKKSVQKSFHGSRESMRKKLVRRSINIVNHKPQQCTSKTLQKSVHKTLTPARKMNSSLKNDHIHCKSAGPILKRAARVKPPRSKERLEQDLLHEKLNRWLIAKGKKPLDGQKLRGFKPTKTIATPVGSPSCTPKICKDGESHWQGLRDEDATDELAVLIRNTMQDVNKCMEEGCCPKALRQTLDDLAKKLPKVKFHSNYWVTLAKVERLAGKTDQQICDLFEQAIIEKAQPIEDIQEAISSMVMEKVDKPKSSPAENKMLKSTCIDVHRRIPTYQARTPNPLVANLIDCERPVLKNASTSPIIFESPTRAGVEAFAPDSPSSVVKLRMVSKSSPVFKRLKSLRTLPDDATAIVTPVRRSVRIAAAQDSYPRSLQDHEPCLSTVQEIFPALKPHSPVKDQNSNVACDIVFDPNLALGKDYADISTVLHF